MAEILSKERSNFIVSFRLKPTQSFVGLQAKIITGDGYEISFHDEMAWLRFNATSTEWLHRLAVGREVLRTFLAVLTIQTEYPFDLEAIQWIEDKPRNAAGTANYVLGRLGPDLIVQQETPSIGIEHIHKGEIYVHLASQNVYYRYALLDYSIALSFPRESIIFYARSVEWAECYFSIVKQNLKKREHARTLMQNNLGLPSKNVTLFFKIANETVIARHSGDPSKIRSPKIEEIRFCVFFSRVVLDRFACYLWYELSNRLPQRLKYPNDEKPPNELFEAGNVGLTNSLTQILSGELS
ncbi:MAG: hypothetical protein Q7J73_01175 [Dehalococcoidales bacterium]|nr:hypothetical protein [Dehalococcoidales bacterium]